MELRLWFLSMIGRRPIHTRYYPEYPGESKHVAYIPGTHIRGAGHTEEMAVGNLILGNLSQLGFILRHEEESSETSSNNHIAGAVPIRRA